MTKKIAILIFFCSTLFYIYSGGNREEAKTATEPPNGRITSTAGNGYYPGNTLGMAWDASPATYRYATGNLFNPNMDLSLIRYEFSTLNLITNVTSDVQIAKESTTAALTYSTGTYLILLQAVYSAENGSEWYSSGKIFASINIDADAPSTPGGLAMTQDIPANFYSSASGTLYTKSDALTLTWTGAADSLSGMQKYQIYSGSNTYVDESTTLTKNVGLSTQGSLTFKVRAVDNANNVSAFSNPVTVFRDTTAPGKVSNMRCELVVTNNTIQGLKILWNKLDTDNPAGGSGIGGYNVSVKQTGAAHTPNNGNPITDTAYTMDFAALIRGAERKAAV